jgi:hypothetical protein
MGYIVLYTKTNQWSIFIVHCAKSSFATKLRIMDSNRKQYDVKIIKLMVCFILVIIYVNFLIVKHSHRIIIVV